METELGKQEEKDSFLGHLTSPLLIIFRHNKGKLPQVRIDEKS